LIQRDKLPGWRPYWAIYLAGVLFWVLTMQGIRLAHWANYLGLVAMSLYLGIYLPIFILLARVAHHRWRLSLVVAAPIAWVGVEVVRGYGPLGFSMALLGHTQVEQLRLIQIADLCGPYTVSFVVMLVAACLWRLLPWAGFRRAWWPAVVLLIALALTLWYGTFRLQQVPPESDRKPLRVALIQGSVDTVFDGDPNRAWETLDQYSELTEQACDRFEPLDLVMWPETMFPVDEVLVQNDMTRGPEAPLDEERVEQTQLIFQQLLQNRVRSINESPDTAGAARGPTSWVFGVGVWQLGDFPSRRYNAALLANPQGALIGRYYKMRPVIFGEYVPFGDAFPALYNLFPLPNGLTPGTEPAAWQVGGITLSPSICFESTMPHLLRWHVAQLTERRTRPDVLINLTNDGWFWGSSILDMHLNCAVFRAVELRRPFLVAANTGFSASIDGSGRVLVKGPRRAQASLLAEVVPDGRSSLYEQCGDIPALACTALSLMLGITGLLSRRETTDAEGSQREPRGLHREPHG
jgi:apolipoprotein N-acyltransferase